ncbi:sigma-54 dependent transcriptional regulator [soil metagenome]
MAKIIVVDDEVISLTILKGVLENAGHDITTASDGEEALEIMKKLKFDIVLSDFNMPGMNGIELTKEILKLSPDSIVILITAFISIRAAVESIKLGAFDYLTKPVDKEELLLSVNRGLERISLVKENILLKQQLERVENPEFTYLTESEEIKRILQEANKVAKSDSTILITGANGTGKEVLAKYIYKNSHRANKQFVVVNCAAIPEQLLESELFGHVKGAFTGAIKEHKGYFEIADNGTIFLDEIGEVDPLLQVKLLRVLQEKQFSRVGDTRIISTNVRIIAATNRDLSKMIEEGKFREDLYYRLNVFEFHLPDLKDRTEDIIFYFNKFVAEFAKNNNKKITKIDPEINQFLISYQWPGNIRELKNAAERATILCDSNLLTPDLLPKNILGLAENRDTFMSNDFNENKHRLLKEFEVKFIIKHLRLNRGNVAATARAINFHPVSLRQKIAKLGINVDEVLSI